MKCIKHIILLFLLPALIASHDSRAQSPGPYPSTIKLNYIRTWEARVPVQDTAALVALPATGVIQATQYFDGTGRPLQTVVRQASPAGRDMVSANVYDLFGREQYKYLPFASTIATAGDEPGDGNFKLDPFQQQAAFYSSSNATGPLYQQSETYFYGRTDYEASPLNRVLTTFAPGNSWVGANKGVSSQYLFNTAVDSVRIWDIAAAAGSIPTTTLLYPPGQLYKNSTTDEQNHQVIDYKDKEGHIILKKVQLWDVPAGGHSGWLSTYYIYDDLDNLRFVIQPRAVEWLSTNSWAFAGTNGSLAAAELCFRYEYDGDKRVVIKKVPGADEAWMIYDAKGRLVMSQDANLRALIPAKWMVTEYDALNRPWRTGLLTDAHDRTYHQNLASGSASYPGTATGYEVLTQTFYDDYSWVSGSGSGLSASMATNRAADGNLFYTTYNAAPAYAVPMTPFTYAIGLPTGSMTKVLGSSPAQYLYSVSFYDDHGRVIQSQSTNYRYGIDTATTQYDFTGKPLRTLLGHKKGGLAVQNHTVLTKMSYDAGARLKSIVKNIDGTGDQLIDSLHYDELGQLQTKYLGNQVDSLAYAYNIRGWLVSINKQYLTNPAATPINYFGIELGYDKPADVTGNTYAHPALNGNISGTIWKTAGSGVNRKYDFTYDNVNRLTGADFNQFTGSLFDKSAKIDFSVSGLTYDANGNILSMQQKGLLVGSSATIDSLIYKYANSGASNRLLGVKDGANNQNSVLGDFHYNPTGKGDTTDYTYDANGNLVTDLNKSITPISYNYLNLPQQVHVNGKGDINYVYDATGNKLAKITMDNLSKHTTTTVYINGFVYQQGDTIIHNPATGTDTLQFVSHEEGRARWAFHRYANGTTGYTWEYDFFEKDHLGNTRVLLTQQKDTGFYKATMEAASRNTENALFYNIPATSYLRSSIGGYPNPDNSPLAPTTPPVVNDNVAKVNGSVQKAGPAIILKVMAGDKIDLGVSYYYTNVGAPAGPQVSASDLVNSLASGIVSMTGGGHGTLSDLTGGSSPLTGVLSSFINNNNTSTAGKPNAYLNWILLDNQFGYVNTYPQSGAQQVGAYGTVSGGQLQPLLGQTGIPITKSGYLYIYVSNSTPGWDVFFDNLTVTQYSGPLLEETHYYPFGLTMAGISDKALKSQYAENKYRYNKGSELQNKEFSDGSGLEMYETQLRELDPQLGRWWQIDSKPSEAESPYSAMGNNPILHNDPLGDTLNPEQRKQADEYYEYMNSGGDQVGRIRNATHGDYERDPVMAALKDGFHFLADITGFNAVDDESASVRQKMDNGTLSTGDVLHSGINIGYATARGEGGGVKGEMTEKPVQPYEVGIVSDLRKRSVGDGLDIHHAPQSQPSGHLIKGYNPRRAAGIALPEAEHGAIPNLKGTSTAGTARQQLARDIRNLRNNTNVPNSSLSQLIDLNKRLWPENFIRKK